MSKNTLRILMLEDNPEDVQIIEHALKKGKLSFVRKNVDTRDEFLEAIYSFQPDIILSDHSLPGFNSREALKITRAESANTPFILVSGTATDSFAASVLREGADDYIPKDDLTPLTDAIRDALKKRTKEKRKREKKLAIRRQYNDLIVRNEALEKFTYTISQHLRSPLTSSLGLLNLAEQYTDVKDVKAVHSMLRASLMRLDQTVLGLLECSKSHIRDVDYEPIKFEQLINSVFEKLEYLDPDNVISRFVHIQDEVPFSSDKDRLIVLLTKVIGNAMTYRKSVSTEDPIVSVEVVITPEQAVITVKDNGTGINPALLSKVYDLFFRGTEKGGGIGLGLTASRQIVDRLKGAMEISSQEGVGTTVRIEVPNATGQESEPSEK